MPGVRLELTHLFNEVRDFKSPASTIPPPGQVRAYSGAKEKGTAPAPLCGPGFRLLVSPHMDTVLVIPADTPSESKKIAALRLLLKQAGVAEHQEARKFKTMVSTMRHMRVDVAIIVEPKNLVRLGERISQCREAKAAANRAIKNLWKEADSLPCRGREPLRRDVLRDPVFIVIAQKRIPAKELPDDVRSLSFEDDSEIVEAIKKARGKATD